VIQRPLRFGATVASFDATEAKKIDGVVDVVQLPQGVAVIAKDTWAAIRGREALKIRWDTSKAETRSDEQMLADYRQLTAQARTALKRGDANRGLAGAVKTVEAEFTFPYLVHAPMEPLNGTIEVHGNGAEIWMGSQLQTIDALVVSKVLELKDSSAVNVHTLLGGGSFGRRGSPTGDLAGELGAIAKAVGGKTPIHLVWTREDDIRGGAYRPLVLHQVKAGVDAQGRIAGWKHVTVSQSIFGGTPFESQAVKDGLDGSAFEGIVDTAYTIDNFQVDAYMAKSPVTVTWYRSVGHSHTAHVMETVVDELAYLAGKDPVAYRLSLLQPREAAVVRMAAEKAGWGKPLPKGTGRGVAFHRSFGSRVAMVAEVQVQAKTVRIRRIVAAADVGTAVNPDVVEAQIEGAIGFALANPLRNRITVNNGAVVQSNFHDYQVTRMREMPDVQVHLIKSAEHPSGIGEPGVATVAPVIGNAIFSATGRRLRSLPFELSTVTKARTA
jgi:isoquinoline 1-oxidoreductase subunit beta